MAAVRAAFLSALLEENSTVTASAIMAILAFLYELVSLAAIMPSNFSTCALSLCWDLICIKKVNAKRVSVLGLNKSNSRREMARATPTGMA